MTLDERSQHALAHGYGRLYCGRVIPIISGGSEGAAEGAGDGAAAGGNSGTGDAGAAGGTDLDGSQSGFRPITSQEDFDRRIQERIARVKTTPPADYEDLKAKAAKLDELENSQKSELQQALDRAAALERERDDARLAAQETRLHNAIIGAASGKLADPTDAIALIDRARIEFGEDGNPTNVETLVTSLLEAKPHLAAGGTRGGSADQGARGTSGVAQLTRAELKTMSPDQIAKAQKEGRLDVLLKG